MDIQNILDYQAKDSEILKVEKQLAQSKNKRALAQIMDIVKQAQQVSALCENQAQEVLGQYNALKKTYDENIKTFLNIQTKDVLTLDESEANEIIRATNALSSNLNILEKKLLAQAEKINAILTEYENAKKRYNSAKEKHLIFKEHFQKEMDDVQPQINNLQQDLKKIAKKVEVSVLERYNSKRSDKIFPVFVPLMENACGGCMMELPMAQIDKIKRDGVLECENCHRYIYKLD